MISLPGLLPRNEDILPTRIWGSMSELSPCTGCRDWLQKYRIWRSLVQGRCKQHRFRCRMRDSTFTFADADSDRRCFSIALATQHVTRPCLDGDPGSTSHHSFRGATRGDHVPTLFTFLNLLCNIPACFCRTYGSRRDNTGREKMRSKRLLFGALLLPVFYLLDQYIHTQYIFGPLRLQQISQRAIEIHGNDTLPLLQQITADLKAEYGAAITEWSKDDWFFNNAGGAMVCLSAPVFDLGCSACGRPLGRDFVLIIGGSGFHGHPTRFDQRVSHLLRHRTADRRPLRCALG